VVFVTLFTLAVAAAPLRAQGLGVIVNNIQLEGVTYDPATGLLTATSGAVSGTIAGQPFTTNLENFALQQGGPGGACSVLDLDLGPINLALLGAHVDTSEICLTITAFQDQGLLGDLLCGLAGGGLGILPVVLDQLPGLLNDVFAQQAGGMGGDVCTGTCTVLDLSLGPVDLTLLGLNVHLDDCDNGPVMVCVSATAGEGLLGDLLCGLAGGGDLLDLGGLTRLLDAILAINGLGDIHATPREILGIVRMIDNALRHGGLSDAEIRRIVRAIERLR